MAGPPNPLTNTADAFQKLGDVMGRVVRDTVVPFADAARKFGEAIKYAVSPVLDKLTNQLVTLGRVLANALAPAFKAVADRVADLAGKVGNALSPVFERLGKFLGPVASGIGSLAVGLAGVVKSAPAAVGGLLAFGQAIGAMVQKANPAAFARFQLAADDLMATIGQGLAPVLEVVAKLVRMAGDTLATFANSLGGGLAVILDALTPVLQVVFDLFGRIGQSIGQVVQAAAPAFTALGEALGAVLEAIQPVLNLLIDVFTGVFATAMQVVADVVQAAVPYVMAFADAVGDMIKTVIQWVRELLAFIGVSLPEGGPGTVKGASVGKATRQAEIGSIESVIQKAQVAAFSIGTGAGRDPALRTASAAESLKAEAAAIRAEMNRIGQRILDLPRNIAAAIARGADAAAGEAVDRFDLASDAVGEFGRDAGATLAGAVGLGDKIAKRFGSGGVAAGVGGDIARVVRDAAAARARMAVEGGGIGGGVVAGAPPR